MTAHGDDVAVSWEEARAANLANWDERVAMHVEAYGLDRYREDPSYLSAVIRHDLAALATHLPQGVAGLDVCHLQCHIGTDTLSLARAGATVTGVDFSRPALDAAADLAQSLGLDATWVHTDVLSARDAVTAVMGEEAAFDLVYTSIGAIGWLADLDRWAAQVAALLRPGGLLYLRDGHPALYALDEEAEGLVTRYRYFPNGRAQAWDEATTYVGDGTIASTRTYEFPHPLSETVNAVLGAGLELLRLDEGDTLPWRFSEAMVELGDDGFAYPAPLRERVPTTFTVVARKRP
ncbi:bifunctional 2-polyprenyl-6-hydroxyphenol methylase/3-demethylubiquinol 3-O-methyltransferase UbiG [Demequina sp. NBRC 110056]|uniref:class I SAM-dependent methyltransferase n=1 Tax=Demequina sp. NBRC 110056 TaxID=1570345 RepID=UPI001F33D9A8|nr:class I SAM-dependent methyltransferase [Demequina sp. NBRC 110056]